MAEEDFKFLEQTRQTFRQIEETFQQNEILSDTLWQDIERKLIDADLGPAASRWIIQRLQQRAKEGRISSGSQAYIALRQELTHLLGKPPTLHYSEQSSVTVMILMGDKGSGKTTSCAKLAYRLSHEGHNVLLVASGRFDSSSIDVLKAWGEQINIPVICQNDGSDAGTFIYDILQSALVDGYDIVLVDTIGQQTTEQVEELRNIMNAAQKVIPDAPHELLVVVDATNGLSAASLVHAFAEQTGLTGVILSKVDSTTKGGFVFALADDLKVPVKFVGTGEKTGQLVLFDSAHFMAALFEKE
ncbi:MAG TPA: signal recognition particle receptor subunit alpha [Ktedonobacteraceae bacterium]|jgi:fused signal recognition particle receptor|nr:signal recognition particle receptor subunit alpha [Ktedonobacteraceae bacterium]